MYSIILTDSFSKELSKLGKKERERIKEKLRRSAESPLHYFEKLVGHKISKLRFGNYRIIAQLSVSAEEIICLSVKHRKNAYGQL